MSLHPRLLGEFPRKGDHLLGEVVDLHRVGDRIEGRDREERIRGESEGVSPVMDDGEATIPLDEEPHPVAQLIRHLDLRIATPQQILLGDDPPAPVAHAPRG